MTASLKFDVPQELTHYLRSEVQRSMRLVEEYAAPYLMAPMLEWRDVWTDFEMNTAAGFPWSSYGLKKKGDVFQFPEKFLEYFVYAVDFDADVLFKSSPKIEFLSLEKIRAEKIRLFMTGPIHFIAAQRRLYARQNEALQLTRWFKIGTSMKYGGAHRITKELECGPGEFVVVFDLPRCDKNFRAMTWIYGMRNKYAKYDTPFDERMGAWVKRNICNVLVILWDGTVIQSRTTNPSGQLNTADDTCFWAAMVYLTLAQMACPDASDFELKNLTMHIYSDDFRGKFGPRFSRLRDARWVCSKLKEVFEIDAKPEEWQVFENPDRTHFLGADTVLFRGIYYAVYDRERLMAAFKYTEGRLTVGQELMRLRQLLIVSYPDKQIYHQFREVYAALLVALSKNDDTEVRLMLQVGLPSESSLQLIHTGLESVTADFRIGTGGGGVKRIMMNGVSQKPDGKRLVEKAKAIKQAVQDAGAGRRPRVASSSLAPSGKGGSGSDGDAKDGATGGGIVAGLGPKPGKGVRPSPFGGRPGANGPSLNFHPPAPPKAKAKKVAVAPSAQKVKKSAPHSTVVPLNKQSEGGRMVSVGSVIRTTGAGPMSSASVGKNVNGVSVSRIMRFGGLKSHSYRDAKGEHLQFQGDQFLGHVNTIWGGGEVDLPSPGARLFFRQISPSALGGAVLQESKNWQRYEFRKLVFKYQSTCDSATNGAIYMQYQADTSLPHVDLGPDEVNHACTLGNMVTTTVYNENVVELVVDPKEITKELTTSQVGDAMFSMDGSFTVSVLDDIALASECGDLLISYDVVFHEPMLSYTVSDVVDSQVILTYNLAAGYAGANNLQVGFFNVGAWPPAVGTLKWEIGTPPAGTGYKGTAVCIGHTVNGAKSPFLVTLNDDGGAFAIQPGMVFFLTLNNTALDGTITWTNGSVNGTLAVVDVTDASFVDDGSWDMGVVPSAGAISGQIQFIVHWEPIGDAY